MVAKNFKFLRRYFRDKQIVLAKMFGVSQSNISDYENDKKEIPHNVLKKISIRYGVSIDDLMNKDLSLEYDLPKNIDLTDAITLGENMLPILTSNVAKTNDNFNKAYDSLYSSLRANSIDALYERIVVLEHAITLFQEAWKESKTYVALSNSLSTVLLIYVLLSQRGIKIGQELLTRRNISSFDIQIDSLRDPNKPSSQNPYEKKQKAFFEKYYDFVYDNIKLLKSNIHFSELGDYYLAMCCFLGFDEDFMEYEVCSQVGFYMLCQLCILDNKYANSFIESLAPIL